MNATSQKKSQPAQDFWNSIGNTRDDLDIIRSISHPGLDVKTGSFLKRANLQILVKIHSRTQDYLRQVVHSVILRRPHLLMSGHLSGNDITMRAEQIMGATDLAELQRHVSGELFRKLESKFKNKSGLALADQILKVFPRGNTNGWEVVRNSAEPYFAIRNLIIHNQSEFDSVFVKNFSSVDAPSWGVARPGSQIPGKKALVERAIKAFGGVVDFVDERLQQFLKAV